MELRGWTKDFYSPTCEDGTTWKPLFDSGISKKKLGLPLMSVPEMIWQVDNERPLPVFMLTDRMFQKSTPTPSQKKEIGQNPLQYRKKPQFFCGISSVCYRGGSALRGIPCRIKKIFSEMVKEKNPTLGWKTRSMGSLIFLFWSNCVGSRLKKMLFPE